MIRDCVAACALAVLACLLGAPAAQAATLPLDPAATVAKGTQALGRALGNYTLADMNGAPLALRGYRGKPLVISLVYTACSSVCPPTTQHVIGAVNEAGRMMGLDRFNVLTIGFDARNDTPARLTQFASTQGIKSPNWQVASADPATIEALLGELGFSYRAVAGGFDHLTQTTIIDREGRIYRHVYGEDFPLQMFMEPLKDVIYGTATAFSFSGIMDRIKYVCTAYDPGASRYRIDYGLVFGSVIAAFSLLFMGGLILREWFRSAHA